MPERHRLRRWVRAIVVGGLLLAVGLYAFCAICVLALRWIDPPTTAVQIERRVQAIINHRQYRKHYDFVPVARISPNLRRAVIAAEDGRFWQHHGFDWVEMQKVLEQDVKR